MPYNTHRKLRLRRVEYLTFAEILLLTNINDLKIKNKGTSLDVFPKRSNFHLLETK